MQARRAVRTPYDPGRFSAAYSAWACFRWASRDRHSSRVQEIPVESLGLSGVAVDGVGAAKWQMGQSTSYEVSHDSSMVEHLLKFGGCLGPLADLQVARRGLRQRASRPQRHLQVLQSSWQNLDLAGADSTLFVSKSSANLNRGVVQLENAVLSLMPIRLIVV